MLCFAACRKPSAQARTCTDCKALIPNDMTVMENSFQEKEKILTFFVDQSSCALSTQELVGRYVYTACTEASSLAGDFCDALQPPAVN